MRDRDSDLQAILSALVNHWGASTVETTLHEVTGAPRHRAKGRSGPASRAKAKLSPVQMAERLPDRVRNKEEIVRIAREFERKQFLPRIGDAKDFLEQNGYDVAGLKNRSSVFRKVLLVLAQLSPGRLQALRADALHSGPMRLGPLSEAIGAAGEQIPSERQTG